ncbi:histidine acid phosphatase-like protein [Dothidotthia symphoricarpi CBS 119687]|uniref:Histidine acid phosphatase-like protein n=1 Tax=Dothidotthia symphoricarpi CBS 119687 TaxID=1392245 RepID=A0A6A6AA20_9PLEO|nr:histidine acid phosphatase-like protein [Dothidotthia symphoricarpi CBS 119687]KAF2127718.1 histidine acid phosphatase-like protein [Dothidotthia symphoricarpi CBS 119687]
MISIALLLAAPASALPAFFSTQTPLQPLGHSQGYKFDALHHLPGISPYFDAIGFGLDHNAPVGCEVTAVSYIIRHGAIYANDKEYAEYIKPFLWKLEQQRQGWSGPLAFMEKWQSPILEDKLEDLTPSGAVAAEKMGRHFMEHYPDLIPDTQRVLTDKKSRTYDTAKNLIKAFPHSEEMEIVRVTKNENGSMEALIPHKSCQAFNKDPGTKEQKEFINIYGASVSKRLAPMMPFELTPNDVVGFQMLCGYESAIVGKRSEICALFTDAEWMAYEYAWDLKYAYMVGPMNPLSSYLGFPWLQTQAELFSHISKHDAPGGGWPDEQRFFLSFTHREVPPFVATALGLFNSSSSAAEEFPTDHINWTRAWKMSDLIPFLGHVGMEKMTCERSAASGDGPGEFVRFIANTAPRPILECQSGPGASCPFDQFKKMIGKGSAAHKDFHKVCDKKD